MVLAADAEKTFQELGSGLIPPDETVMAVVRALPKGEAWRRSERGNLRAIAITAAAGRHRPAPIPYEGIAASWPTAFARHESAPNSWSTDTDWHYWVVITDRQLHAIEGHIGKGGSDATVGPEAASFPLDQIAEIAFQKSAVMSLLDIWFTDGSSVQLELGRQKLDRLIEAIRPFERPDSGRPRSMRWMPQLWAWILGLALLIGGMAVTIGSSEGAVDTRLLADRGEITTATVEGITPGDGDSSKVSLAFTDEFGFSYEGSLPTCAGIGDKEVGDTVEIVYDPDPDTGEMSVAHFTDCEYSTSANPVLLVIGIVALAAGTFVILRTWQASGWKRRRLGIVIALIGVMFAGAAVSEGFYYLESVYFGAALAIIGIVPQFARRERTVLPAP